VKSNNLGGDHGEIVTATELPTTDTSNDALNININSEVIKQKRLSSSIQLQPNNDAETPPHYDSYRHLFGLRSGGSDAEPLGNSYDDDYDIDENQIQSEGFDEDSSYNSNYGSSSSSGSTYDDNSSGSSYGSSSGSSSYGSGSSSSSYGGSAPTSSSSSYGGGSSSSSYGGSSPYSSSSSSSYGGSSSSYGGSSSYGKSSYGKSTSYKRLRDPIKVRLSYAITLTITILTLGMFVTAHQLLSNPKGRYANSCVRSIECLECIWKLCYNLYHCRLGEIHDVVCAIDDEEEDYTEQELATMKLRPGIEKALTVEHTRAINKMTGKEVRDKIKKKIKKKISEKIGPVRKGPGMGGSLV